MFNQNTDKPLEGTKNSTVQHDGRIARAVFGNVLRIEAARHREVDLDGATLPDPANTVPQGEFDFRPVECALTRQQIPVKPGGITGRFQAVGVALLVAKFERILR